MLELRPNCEFCDRDLPPDSRDARICTYECTYCAGCVDTVLRNVCPTCGGGFCDRPIRPQRAYRDAPKLGLTNQSASTTRVHSKYSAAEIEAFCTALAGTPPNAR